MKHTLPILLIFALLAPGCSVFNKKPAPQKPVMMSTRAGADRNQNYADQFKDAAMLEMERGGVPASITLAQGILESGAGSSDLAQNANNHFGIKCGSNWKGKTYKKKDDDKDADGNLIESCFRKYEKVEESFLDHAEFLHDPKKEFRYGFLFKLDRTDYKGWAEGLESSGYSTSDTYSEKLIDIIERYKLYEYDLPATSSGKPNRPPDPNDPNKGNESGAEIPLPNPSNRIGHINETQVVLAREGETITDIAKAYRLNANTVAEYNDRGYTPIQKLKANTRVFIQQKQNKWRGNASEHVVKSTESMFDISQLYGMKINRLLSYNGLRPGQEPAVGERIHLKGKRKKGDNVRIRDSNEDPTPNPPDSLWPSPPSNGKLEPDEEGYLPEIGGGDQEKPTPEPTKPPVTPEPTPPPVSVKPPSVVGTPYPTDPTPSQPDKPTTPPANSNSHTVVKGDTLTNIARRYSTTVPRLRQLNGLKDDNIKIGQALRIW